MKLKGVLAKVASPIGYLELEPKREEMILGLAHVSDVFISLLTGSGSTLCYSLVPAVFDEAGMLSARLLHCKHPIELSRACS